jgi:adenylate kinase family enzyme
MCRVAVSVLGPPAVGKSTLVGHLAERLGASVFRLREFAAGYRRTHPETGEWFVTDDPLGWFRDETVARLLRIAFFGTVFRSWPVILENLPGNATQLADTSVVLEVLHVRHLVVELSAPDAVLWERVRRRRVCPTCEPDPDGDPHRPATARPDLPGRCSRCDGHLLPRRGDDGERFAQRLARYHEEIEGIRRAALHLSLTYHSVPAVPDVPEVVNLANAVVHRALNDLSTVEARR